MPLPRIPKLTKKKDRLSQANQHETKEVETILTNSYLYPGKYWTAESIQLIHNPEHNKRYRERKIQIKEEIGQKTLPESFVYICCKKNDIETILTNGFKVNPDYPGLLGDSKMGVHAFRWADVCLEYYRLKMAAEQLSLLMLKVVLGRTKCVGINASPALEPTPNYHCHVPLEQAKPTDAFSDAQSKSQVYMYEYNDDMLPELCPRQCLPYALVNLKYNGPQPVDSYSRFPLNAFHQSPAFRNNLIAIVSPLYKQSPTKKTVSNVIKKSEVQLKNKFSLFGSHVKMVTINGETSPAVSSASDSECCSGCKSKIVKSPEGNVMCFSGKSRDPRISKSNNKSNTVDKNYTKHLTGQKLQPNINAGLTKIIPKADRPKISQNVITGNSKQNIKSPCSDTSVGTKKSTSESMDNVWEKLPKQITVRKLSNHFPSPKPDTFNTDEIDTGDEFDRNDGSKSVAERLKHMLLKLSKDVFDSDPEDKKSNAKVLKRKKIPVLSQGNAQDLVSETELPLNTSSPPLSPLTPSMSPVTSVNFGSLPITTARTISSPNIPMFRINSSVSVSDTDTVVDRSDTESSTSKTDSLTYTDELLSQIFIPRQKSTNEMGTSKVDKHVLCNKAVGDEINKLAISENVIESPASPPVCEETGNFEQVPSCSDVKDTSELLLEPLSFEIENEDNFQKQNSGNWDILLSSLNSSRDKGICNKDNNEKPSLNRNYDTDNMSTVSMESFQFDFEDVDPLNVTSKDSQEILNSSFRSIQTLSEMNLETVNLPLQSEKPKLVGCINLDSDYESDDCFIVDPDTVEKDLHHNECVPDISTEMNEHLLKEKDDYTQNSLDKQDSIQEQDTITNESLILAEDVLDLCSSDEDNYNEQQQSGLSERNERNKLKEKLIIIDLSDSEYDESLKDDVNNSNSSNNFDKSTDGCPLDVTEDRLCLAKQLTSALSSWDSTRKRSLSQSDASHIDGDSTKIKRQKIQEELQKTCQALRKKVLNVEESEFFHKGPGFTEENDIDTVSDVQEKSLQPFQPKEQTSCSFVLQQDTESDNTSDILDSNHNVEKECSDFDRKTVDMTIYDRDINETNGHVYTPNVLFYTKYSFPSLEYKHRGKPIPFTEESFGEFDRKVCDLYKKFTKYYEKLKKLEDLLRTTDKNSLLYRSAYQKYRKAELYIAELHIQLEADLTHFEVVSDPSEKLQSTWQKTEVENIEKTILCELENLKKCGSKESDSQIINSLLVQIEDVRKTMLVPRLPKDSPGNKEKLLCKILTNTVNLSKVVFIKKKLLALEKLRDELDGAKKKLLFDDLSSSVDKVKCDI